MVLSDVQSMLEGVRSVISGLASLPGLEGMFGGAVSAIDSAISSVGNLRSAVKKNLRFEGTDAALISAMVDPIDAAVDKLTEWQNAVNKAITTDSLKALISSPFDDATSAIGTFKEQLLGEIAEIDVADALAEAYKQPYGDALDAHDLIMGTLPESITGVPGTDAQGVPIPGAAGGKGGGTAEPKDLSVTFTRLLRTIETLAESTRRTTGGALEGLTDVAAKAAKVAVGIAAPVVREAASAARIALATGQRAAVSIQSSLSAALRTLTQHSKTGTAESLAAAQAVLAALRYQLQQNVADFKDLVGDGKHAAAEAIRSAKEVTSAAVRNIRTGVQRELDTARTVGREVAYFLQRANELARQGRADQALALLESAKGQLPAVAYSG